MQFQNDITTKNWYWHIFSMESSKNRLSISWVIFKEIITFWNSYFNSSNVFYIFYYQGNNSHKSIYTNTPEKKVNTSYLYNHKKLTKKGGSLFLKITTIRRKNYFHFRFKFPTARKKLCAANENHMIMTRSFFHMFKYYLWCYSNKTVTTDLLLVWRRPQSQITDSYLNVN